MCETCEDKGYIEAGGSGDQSGGYAQTCPDCGGRAPAGLDSGPVPPWRAVADVVLRSALERMAGSDRPPTPASEEAAQAAADGPTIAAQAAEIAELRRQLAAAANEADYWRSENAAIREAAARAMTDALEMLRPHVEWEAKLALAVERASALEQQLVAAQGRALDADARTRDLVTKLITAYMANFPDWEYVSPEQALAVIVREFAALRAQVEH